MKEKYYSDGVTRYSDPLHKNLCLNCGRKYWTVMLPKECSKCGSNNIFSTFDSEELKETELQYRTYKKDGDKYGRC